MFQAERSNSFFTKHFDEAKTLPKEPWIFPLYQLMAL